MIQRVKLLSKGKTNDEVALTGLSVKGVKNGLTLKSVSSSSFINCVAGLSGLNVVSSVVLSNLILIEGVRGYDVNSLGIVPPYSNSWKSIRTSSPRTRY